MSAGGDPATRSTTLEPLAPPAWRPLVRFTALTVAALALLTFVGWGSGIRLLASVRAAYTPMAPQTATALLLLAFSLWTKTLPYPALLRVLGRIAVLPVIAISLGTLLSVDLPMNHGPEAPVGVMSPLTALALVPAAVSLFPPRTAIARLLNHAALAALIPLLIGFTVILGYVYGMPLFDRSTRIPVALNTGIALLLLSVGILAGLGPNSRPLAPFIGDSVRARMLRAFVPLVVGTVVLHALFTNLALSWSPRHFSVFGTVTALLVLVLFGLAASSVSRRIAAAIERAEAGDFRSRARLGALLEQLPDFVAAVRGRSLVFANPAMVRALGHAEPSALEGTSLLDLIHPDDCDAVKAHLDELEQGTVAPAIREQRWNRRDGEPLTVEVSARRADFDDGEAVLLVARDVSERRRLEEQLRQAVKMDAIGKLAGGVAHDFNNMLTAILSFSRFVQEDLGPGHPSQPDVAEVIASAERAASLTRQLLTFSRKQLFDPRPLDVNDVLGRMERMLQRVLGEDVELVTVKGRDLGFVRSDPSHIEQILLNLAVNARDAMPDGGKLTIETSTVELDESYVRGHLGARPGPYVLLAVTDTGVGMDDETLAHLFEPFFTTKAPGSGTGLGLSTVYGIVKQAAGDIIVYSAPGLGTTFKIYLPRVDETLAEARLAPQRAAQAGSETVLLVEDDPAVRAVALRTLQGHGYRVLEAPTPEQALDHARTGGPIHLLMTDVVMPGLNGRELASKVKGLRPDVRVLFMSGYTGGALLHQGIFEAGDAYLQKPFTPDLLAQKVRDTLDGRISPEPTES